MVVLGLRKEGSPVVLKLRLSGAKRERAKTDRWRPNIFTCSFLPNFGEWIV